MGAKPLLETYFKEHGIFYLPQDEYDKAVGQLRLQLTGIFSLFDMYGMGVFIPQAVEEAVKLAEDFGLRVRGVEKQLSLELVRKSGRSKEGLNNG
jgi:hypothetical protein